MKQYKALYLLESVTQALNKLALYGEFEQKISGLYESLSTFDVITTINHELPVKPDPLLCVLNNIITRGTPTFPSIFIEEVFSEVLLFSERDKAKKYEFCYPLADNYDNENFSKLVFNSLHLIDPGLKNPQEYLEMGDTDSRFERDFLLKYIPAEKSYLCQLFQHQRGRGTIGKNASNKGRVDFSLEIPYLQVKSSLNKFKKSVDVKNRKKYIVEVDGKKYHSELIDDLKDFEIAGFSNNINHIREDSVYRDVNDLLKSIMKEDYISVIEQIYQSGYKDQKEIFSYVLSPVLIARIQKFINQYLLANFNNIKDLDELRVLIVERDVPCGGLAVQDYNELLGKLASISNSKIKYPKIKAFIQPSVDFKNSGLHKYSNLINTQKADTGLYDLIIDISALRRSGIAGSDSDYFKERTVVIRSSHFTVEQTKNPVYISELVNYKEFTRHLSNERHETIEDTTGNLSYFLRNIFRKLDFRDGQLPILNRALQNKPVIGLLPTGGGKSLTYQLATILQPAITVVVDPIRSLMLDQYNGLKKIGIDRCEFINSTQTSEERRYTQNKLLPGGQLQFIFVSPERFVIVEFRKSLESAASNGVYFGYCVIDEVHCVSEWGHDFRTPYLNLGLNAITYCKTLSKRPVTLFGLTATASFDVLADIERELQIPDDDGNALIRYENTVRDEMNYSILQVDGDFEDVKVNNITIKKIIGDEKLETSSNVIQNLENTLNDFNKVEKLKAILTKTYSDYLPDFNRQELGEFLRKSISDLELCKEDFQYDEQKNQYNYGIILFCPHRQGSLGVRDFMNILPEFLPKEKIGYFMGSSDDEDSEKIDKDSFNNLEEFVANNQSLMVATKAFGMGIDKPNVRSTIHVNIPQSIESFVQEAGRAGRDKKLSISHILYNNQKIQLDGKPYNLDKDILLYFHKNSFKGKIKERQTLYELRTEIIYPNTTRLEELNESINELYGQNGIELYLQLGSKDWVDFLFVKTIDDKKIGSLNIKNKGIKVKAEISNEVYGQEVLYEIRSRIPFDKLADVDSIRRWLTEPVVNKKYEIGIEKRLSAMTVGKSATLQVPFTNRYYSMPKRDIKEFKLNPIHRDKVRNNPKILKLINGDEITEGWFGKNLKEAIYNGKSYDEFIESLKLDEANQKELLRNTALQRDYYIPRSQEDTAKGIYRLFSIGVIDTYTIDYQNKLYTVSATKKTEDEYFGNLERLFMRYTSARMSKRLIEQVKNEYENHLEENNATCISICLKNLTDFVYEKIQRKRLQAIEDMIDLCETSIEIADPIEQSQKIKDAIYYYFNAKYSRFGNDAILNGVSEPASMPDDRETLEIADTIRKYIRITETDKTGEFKNNIKHLRGSTMKMLRSYPNEPQYLILKAFSLILLSETIDALQKEGIREMVRGLVEWRKVDNELDVIRILADFKKKIADHIELENIEQIFNEIEDLFYSQYYLEWTQNFSNKFKNNYQDVIK